MTPLADTGRVIAGRYRLEAPVGRGAMGVVWRARDQLLDRDVAVKEVQIADTLTENERSNAYQRTLREAKTAARLSHPGVVSVYDVADDGGRPWIVMELVNARSLDQVLAAEGPLSPRQTAEIGRQLLSALSVAHGAGVLHRDVKPSNVLLSTEGRAVLTDFGIATFQGDPKLTQTGMVMGSPGFTAPERIRGGGATPASDLWSLGATLYAAVEGHGPYESRGGAITTMSAIINEDAPAAPAAGELARVIEALLRREPADRPDAVTASRMISDLLHLLPERPHGAPGYEPTAISGAARAGSPAEGGHIAAARDVAAAGLAAGAADPIAAGAATWMPEASPDPYGLKAGVAESAASQNPPIGPNPPMAADLASATPVSPVSPPTRPQPSFEDAGAWAGESNAAGSRFAMPPAPDFSSWYDQSPRSGSRSSAGYSPPAGYGPSAGYSPPAGYGPSAPPGSPSAPAWPGAEPASAAPEWSRQPDRGGQQGGPGGPPPRSSGLRWKLALVALALIGAGAGAAAIMALRHHSTASPPNPLVSQQANGNTATGTPVNIDQAINEIRSPAAPPPAGFITYRQPAIVSGSRAGFQLARPTGWSVLRTGTYETKLVDPQLNAYLMVDLTPHTYSDMLTEARYIKNQSLAKDAFPGYRQVGLTRWNIRGRPGAYWKFLWNDNGVEQEVLDLMYIANTTAGQQSYALYFTSPQSSWNALHTYFDEEAQTFAPLP